MNDDAIQVPAALAELDKRLRREAFLREAFQTPQAGDLVFNLCQLGARDTPTPLSDHDKRDVAAKALAFVANFFNEDDPGSIKLCSALREIGLALVDLNEKKPARILQTEVFARHPPKSGAVELARAKIMALIAAAAVDRHRFRSNSATAKLIVRVLKIDAVRQLVESRAGDDPTAEPERRLTAVLREYVRGQITDPIANAAFQNWRAEYQSKFKDISDAEWERRVIVAARIHREDLLLLARS